MLIGLGFLAGGALVSAYVVWLWRWQATDGNHRLARMYHHYYRLQSWPHKNGISVAPPAAAGLLLAGVAIIASELLGEAVTPLYPVVVIAGLGLSLVMMWTLIRPPAWLFPPWLREARRREKAGEPSNVPLPRGRATGHESTCTSAGLSPGSSCGRRSGYFRLPVQHLLIGLGAGLPILVQHTNQEGVVVVDNMLATKANTIWDGSEAFDFRIVDSVEQLDAMIRSKADEGHAARLTGGFCWRWSNPEPDGALVPDVKVGSWQMPWNARPMPPASRPAFHHRPTGRPIGTASSKSAASTPPRRVRLRGRHLWLRPALGSSVRGLGRRLERVLRLDRQTQG